MQPVHAVQSEAHDQTVDAYQAIKVVPITSKRQTEADREIYGRPPGEPTDS